MKRVDEYHLTGITLERFVRWERRPPSSTEGRGESRNEGRGEGRPRAEQNKADDNLCSEGMVSHGAVTDGRYHCDAFIVSVSLVFGPK